jgi:hypothetical protein
MTLVRTIGALALAVVVAGPLPAQWPAFETPGIPRTPDGAPDMNAPAPRTRDGKPDLSGIWTNSGRGQAGGRGRGAAPEDDRPPLASFGNVGQGIPGGLPYQPWAEELVEERMTNNSKDNPDAHCLPMGFMQFHTHPQPRKIVQTPTMVLIIYEANSGLRQIFLDGRPLPDEDAEPWWYGYSVGKWEGDTLVVETTQFLDRAGWLDVRGSPLTQSAHVTERFRRVNFGTLEVEITVDDPEAYTMPWTVRLNQTLMADTELIEFICEDRDATHYIGGQ